LTTLAFDQQHDRGARPQSEVELELLRPLVRDQALHLLFLLRGERAATACRTAAPA